MKTDMNGFDKDKKVSESLFKKYKYQFTSILGMIGMAFLLGWLFLVPALAVVFLTYSLIIYLKERKNRITVSIKPNAEMIALMKRETELQREKDRLIHEMQTRI